MSPDTLRKAGITSWKDLSSRIVRNYYTIPKRFRFYGTFGTDMTGLFLNHDPSTRFRTIVIGHRISSILEMEKNSEFDDQCRFSFNPSALRYLFRSSVCYKFSMLLGRKLQDRLITDYYTGSKTLADGIDRLHFWSLKPNGSIFVGTWWKETAPCLLD